jgi:hypothetical protein
LMYPMSPSGWVKIQMLVPKVPRIAMPRSTSSDASREELMFADRTIRSYW